MRKFSTVLLVFTTLTLLPARSHGQAGSVDTNFNAGLNTNAQVYVVVQLTNGQILIGGSFTNVGGIKRTNVARLNSDGSVDATFDPRAANNGYVTTLAVQPDGKVVVGGLFTSPSLPFGANLVRLNTNGTLDAGFDPDFYADAIVNAVAVQSDGKIIVAGGFTAVDGLPRRIIARLYTNGTLDTNFDACVASGGGEGATAVALRPDGKIFMSGSFTFSGGYVRNGVALLGLNGDINTNYAPEPGMDPGKTAYTLVRRSDESVLLAGNFTSYHGEARGGITQLTPGGAVDFDFNPGTGINFGNIYALAIQPDGKVIAGGDFSAYNGNTRFGIARINLDGSVDPTFDPGSGVISAIGTTAIQSDGKILVGGRFSSFNGVPRNGLVRLKGGPLPFRLTPAGWSALGQFQLTFTGEDQSHYRVEQSSNLTSWSSLTNFTAGTNATPIIDPQTNSLPKQFYRALLLP